MVPPPYHRAFCTPRGVCLIARMRELYGVVPTGFKLSPGSRRQFPVVCKAMIEEGTAPDFLSVHDTLVGAGPEDRIRAPTAATRPTP